MQREKVEFQPNVPEALILRFDEGKLITNNFGESYMYSLDDDRVAFVPPVVEAQRKDLGIGKGEPFEVLKKVAGKKTEWRVRRLEAEPMPDLKASLGVAGKSAEKPMPVGSPVRPVPEPPNEPTTRPQPNILHTKASALLASGMIAAIDATLQAQEYARAKGVTVTPMEINFNAEDVRAMAITLAIEIFKSRRESQGGNAWQQ